MCQFEKETWMGLKQVKQHTFCGCIWVLGHRLHTLVRRIEMEDDVDDSDDYFVFFASFLDMLMCYLIVLSYLSSS